VNITADRPECAAENPASAIASANRFQQLGCMLFSGSWKHPPEDSRVIGLQTGWALVVLGTEETEVPG